MQKNSREEGVPSRPKKFFFILRPVFAYIFPRFKFPAKHCRAHQVLYECIVCMNSFQPDKTPRFNAGTCGHDICQGCIRHYVDDALEDDRYMKSFERIQCPEQGCKETFNTNKVILKIFSKPEMNKWWLAAIAKNYISNKVTRLFKKMIKFLRQA